MFLKNRVKRNRQQKQTLKCEGSVCFSFVTVTCVKKIWNFVYIFYYYFFASIISIWIPWWCIYCFMVKLRMSYVLFNLFNLVVWFLHFPSYCEKDYLLYRTLARWFDSHAYHVQKSRWGRERQRGKQTKTRWVENPGISEIKTFAVCGWKLISCLGLEIYSCWCL